MARDATLDSARLTNVEPLREYEIRGGDGVRLSAHEWGNPTGPAILFIHGWSQCDMCWGAQVASPLAERFRIVAFDLRGHGMSEKPRDPAAYAEGQLWADDLAAVIEQVRLERPTLVAWSYGGFVVGDYLRAYGDGGLAGIALVGGAVVLRPPGFEHIGPGFLENALDGSAADPRVSIPAMQRFLRACSARPLDDDLWRTALCWNMTVPAEVRGALIARDIDVMDVLAGVSVPMLVVHGSEDAIVLPSMSEHVLAHCERAVASWHEGVGHMPFIEDAERFNLAVAAFVDRAAE